MEKLRKKNHMPCIWDHYQMEMNNDTEPKILYELCENIRRMLYKYFGPPRDDYKEWRTPPRWSSLGDWLSWFFSF